MSHDDDDDNGKGNWIYLSLHMFCAKKIKLWKTFGIPRKKLHKLAFSAIFSQDTGSFEKYVQTLVRSASSDFKTLEDR